MKKKGDQWKKFENLEKDLLLILDSSENSKTINEIKKDLENMGTKASWNTVKDYLESLYLKKKIKKISPGNNTRFLFFEKK